MIISLCGDESYKKIIINEFNKKYKDKITMCDYFKIKFNTIIETESVKYRLIDNCIDLNIAREKYSKYVDDRVMLKINKIYDDNKDKIILLYGDEVLTKDFVNTSFFHRSDIKVLCVDMKKINEEINYDKSLFDIIFSKREEIDVKKLVKI